MSQKRGKATILHVEKSSFLLLLFLVKKNPLNNHNDIMRWSEKEYLKTSFNHKYPTCRILLSMLL